MDLLKRNECDHEMDPKTAVFDKRYGRRGVCLKCGINVVSWKTAGIRHAAPGQGKKHMSKKERRKAKTSSNSVAAHV